MLLPINRGGGATARGTEKGPSCPPGLPLNPLPATGRDGGGPNAAILTTLVGYQRGELPNHTQGKRRESGLYHRLLCQTPSPAQEIN